MKVIGNTNFQMGEWCHVRLPSFNEDSYMFISKCSFESSPDNEYINTLTLVDYPPSLGKSKKSKTNDEDAENSDNSDTDTSNSDNSNSDNNTDSNSTDNNTSGNTNNTDGNNTNTNG